MKLRSALALAGLAAATLSAPPARARANTIEVQEVAETGSMPKGASLSPDGKKFYVTNFGQENVRNITVYDTATLGLLDTIDVPGIVVESVLSQDGRTLYASNFRRNSVQFIDVASKRVRTELPVSTHPKILVLSPDQKQLFAANWAGASVSQIDVTTAKVVRTLPAGLHPRGMAVTRAGKLFIANFDGASMDIYEGEGFSKHHQIPACPIPRHLALSPDDKTLFISCFHDSTLQAMDVDSEQITHRVLIGSSPKSIEVSRDGRYVWSADYGKETNSVSIVDTTDWSARVYPVPGMDRGSGIAVTADGQHALVTGWYDNHVYLVGFAGTGGHPDAALAKIQSWIRRPKHDG